MLSVCCWTVTIIDEGGDGEEIYLPELPITTTLASNPSEMVEYSGREG